MADNQQTADSSAAAQASAAPAQPAATHQPTEQPAQGPAISYAQYPNAYGQAYQSYQQYGYNQYGGAYVPPQAMYPQAAPQPEVPEDKLWVYGKTGLHSLGVVLSICTLGMGLSLISSEWAYMAAVACPVPVLCLIWSAAELIVRAVHKFQSGIHPGGQVAACLIIWLAAAIVGPLESVFAVTNDGYCDYNYDPDTGYFETEDCYDPWNGKKGVWIAISVFTCILWLIYFVLFIGACVDTARRNNARRMVMVVNPATYWGPPAQGWQPMPQQANVPTQQQGQYMTVPQPARTHGSANTGQGQDIPLQNRTPSPITPYETPNEVVDEKGKGPAQAEPSGQQSGHGVREFYTPGN